MTCRAVLTAALVLLLAAPGPATAETRPYAHPRLDFQFAAAPGWRDVPRPGNPGTCERMDPETGIHVLLWMTSTEQDAARYLAKMSHMMDLDPVGDAEIRRIDAREVHVLDVPGRIDGRAVQTLLAVIDAGRSRERPRERRLHVVQIWCPAVDHARLAARMDALLASVRITDRVLHGGDVLPLYPETTVAPPDVPSPWTAANGRTYVTIRTGEGRYGLVDVTVENGAPAAYAEDAWGKGRQLVVDGEDFPTLARTGRHDPDELADVRTITGRSLADITADARPGGLSRSGFLAADEELIAVLRADDATVGRLGLTHPDLARPLFHVVNVVVRELELHRQERRRARVFDKVVLYGGHELRVRAEGGKGWQESIFADEVLGYWQITVAREPTHLERRHLDGRYGHLSAAARAELAHRLTAITTGEMVPFFIQRYGFYEGQVFYRADPLAIASVFGLRELSVIDAAAASDLPAALMQAPSSPRSP